MTTYADRFPLLVWQGELRDSGETVVVNPAIWESDRNPGYNASTWANWFQTPNGGGIIMDIAYANQTVKSIQAVWVGEYDQAGTFPMQPGMIPSQGNDRPVGINGVAGELGNSGTPNQNSLTPQGLVLTRERIEYTLGPSANAILLAVRYYDRLDLAGDYTVYVQIERVP